MRTSSIPAGCVIEGSIRGAGDLVVRGAVEGPITLDGTLTIDVGGLVRGEARARSIVLRGTLEGPAHASELVRLEAGARLFGDVFAERISAASGALVRGRVRMAGAERLRRTVGGTLEAPFSSAGALEAPRSSAGALEAPRSSAGALEAVAAPPPGPPIRTLVTTPAHPTPGIRTQLTTPAPPLERPDVAPEILAATYARHDTLTASPERAPSVRPLEPLGPERVARGPAAQAHRAQVAARPATPPPPVAARPATPPPPVAARPAASPPPVAARPATPPPPPGRLAPDRAARARATEAAPAPEPAHHEGAAPPEDATVPMGLRRSERKEPAHDAAARPKAPPPAIVPALGRVRVRRRDEAAS